MAAHDYRYDFPIPLPGTREEVFSALTDPSALRQWFAEHVEVDPHEGGAFRFWGRHTLGLPGENDATQRITRFDPDNALGFSWRLLDRESAVTLTLRDNEAGEDDSAADAGEGTLLRVEHRFSDLPDIGRAAEMVDDLWRVHTGSLLQYMMGSDAIYRPDFSNGDPEVRLEIEIDAPPETVFRVLTEPEYIGQWFPAPAPVVDPHVGGRYGFGYSYEQDGRKVEPPPSRILEFEQDRKLTVTWPDWRGDATVPEQKVSWQLEDLGGRTRLVLVHDGFTRPVDVSDYPFGWGHFLDEIRKVADAI